MTTLSILDSSELSLLSEKRLKIKKIKFGIKIEFLTILRTDYIITKKKG
jgi:hypothetical protein